MTFNIRFDYGGSESVTHPDGWNSNQNPRSARVKSLLNTWSPDIVGSQEGVTQQIKDLTGIDSAYDQCGVGRLDGNTSGEYNSIFYRKSRFRMDQCGHFWLSQTPDQPGTTFPDSMVRMVTWAKLYDVADNRHYLVANTHWDFGLDMNRRLSAGLMVKKLRNLLTPGETLFVLGDLNTEGNTEEVSTLKKGLQLEDAYRMAQPQESGNEATWHDFTGNPAGSRIDFVLTSSGLTISSGYIIRDSFLGRYPSDHFPVQTQVCIAPRPAYFFKDGSYVKYDRQKDAIPNGYPRSIASSWPGLTFNSIDAAVNWGNGKAYFFSGSQYTRYDIAAGKADEGYPRSIVGSWPGLTFDSIDAAVNWGDGKAYFFRGSQYIRYDIAADEADDGYPRSIASSWPGLTFDKIDAAINWGNGKAYFFSGSQYLRYDIAKDKTDQGFPQEISTYWPDLFPSGIDAAVEW